MDSDHADHDQRRQHDDAERRRRRWTHQAVHDREPDKTTARRHCAIVHQAS